MRASPRPIACRAAGAPRPSAVPGIHPGSILVVDRAVEAEDGDIVIARINDELCVKRLCVRHGRIWLMPENDRFQPIEVIETMDFEVWGRVMHAIRSY